jgi:D-alanine-D-alanine ligase
MKYSILAELREDYPSLINGPKAYNDYVSRRSVMDFCEAINSLGFECTFFGGMKALLEAYQNHTDISDTIFINYNYGLPAPYKRTQCPTLLELMGAKYSGADPFVALLVNDKEYTKRVLHTAGICAPSGILINSSENILYKLSRSKLTVPLVVKPNCEGSSLGITAESLCNDHATAVNIATKLLPQYHEILIEEYIAGYECTVWIIGNPGNFRLVAPLLISEKGLYYFEHRIFTMQDKADRTREYSLPDEKIGAEQTEKIKNISKKIFIELGLRDYARIDFRISNNCIYFIEANALPIFSQTSEIGKIAQLYNIPYVKLCKLMIDTVTARLMA